ncbi:1-aminocyclopropane-1-carboxylate synthase 1 [Lojkania enalia]|uniref:1-aminocyclopropane-1-carboxylate synthase 1 n=1 Tax=Lojkania enalia TaxID=147567 RepID=A0A9P4MVT1_9PLEO|nr:1-aminocyclopropane-1-carboxylate synthase 1 [Didymosphaeria enalia]
MLSTRGHKYAALDLAAGYTKIRGDLYDKFKHPNDLVCLTQAENFLMQKEVAAFVKKKCISSIDASVLSYHEGPFGSKRLRQAMSGFVNLHFSPATPTLAEYFSFVSGVTALNEVLALCLTEENDGLLMGMPIYGSFASDLPTKSDCRLLYAPFGDIDQFGLEAVERYERTLQQAERKGTKIKGLVITNPHNPLGRCYSRKSLKGIMRFCSKHNIHLISDEVYAMSVYYSDGRHPGFTSVLSIDPSGIIDHSLVHVLYGMSKDFAAAGLRLGCLVSKNAELTKAVRSLARFHCASPLADAIATTILEDKAFHIPFLQKSRKALFEHQIIATDALNRAGIPFSARPNAGFFLWIDLSNCLRGNGWEAEMHMQQELFKVGLEMSTGLAYHNERPGWFRFIFSVNRDMLKEGLRRLICFYQKYSIDIA